MRDDAAIQSPPSDALAKFDEDAFFEDDVLEEEDDIEEEDEGLEISDLDTGARRDYRSRRTSKSPQNRRSKR